MEMHRTGRTVAFSGGVSVLSWGSIGGKLEGQGPLGSYFDEIEKAFAEFHACTDKPTCILMHTTKGKGVSFMENQVGWHGKAPNDEEYKQAMGELNAAMAELEAAK